MINAMCWKLSRPILIEEIKQISERVDTDYDDIYTQALITANACEKQKILELKKKIKNYINLFKHKRWCDIFRMLKYTLKINVKFIFFKLII